MSSHLFKVCYLILNWACFIITHAHSTQQIQAISDILNVRFTVQPVPTEQLQLPLDENKPTILLSLAELFELDKEEAARGSGNCDEYLHQLQNKTQVVMKQNYCISAPDSLEIWFWREAAAVCCSPRYMNLLRQMRKVWCLLHWPDIWICVHQED